MFSPVRVLAQSALMRAGYAVNIREDGVIVAARGGERRFITIIEGSVTTRKVRTVIAAAHGAGRAEVWVYDRRRRGRAVWRRHRLRRKTRGRLLPQRAGHP